MRKRPGLFYLYKNNPVFTTLLKGRGPVEDYVFGDIRDHINKKYV